MAEDRTREKNSYIEMPEKLVWPTFITGWKKSHTAGRKWCVFIN